MDQEILQWINLADMDYGVAKHLYQTYYPKPYEIICYHCQQSAEKAIKAVIVADGTKGGMPKLHDLSFLLNQIKNVVKIEEKYYEHKENFLPIEIDYPISSTDFRTNKDSSILLDEVYDYILKNNLYEVKDNV